jgi:type IV pilus assembly protein PilZ
MDSGDKHLPIKKPSITLANDRNEKSGIGSGKENRFHTRLPLVVRAEIEIEGAQQTGYLTNLSLGGAFLATQEMLAIGTPVHLHVFLPWKLGEFEAEARIVWSSGKDGNETDPPGVGLQFTGLDSRADGRLRAYVGTFLRLVAQIEE